MVVAIAVSAHFGVDGLDGFVHAGDRACRGQRQLARAENSQQIDVAALASGSPLVIVSWVAQTFLQLVLLPIIIVGQNIQASEAEKRAIATYDDATAILEEAKQIQQHLQIQDKALDKLITDLARVEGHVKPKNAPKK